MSKGTMAWAITLPQMRTFVFRCPTLGLNVQGWIDDDESTATADAGYHEVKCLACRQVHLVNPSTDTVRPPEST